MYSLTLTLTLTLVGVDGAVMEDKGDKQKAFKNLGPRKPVKGDYVLHASPLLPTRAGIRVRVRVRVTRLSSTPD